MCRLGQSVMICFLQRITSCLSKGCAGGGPTRLVLLLHKRKPCRDALGNYIYIYMQLYIYICMYVILSSGPSCRRTPLPRGFLVFPVSEFIVFCTERSKTHHISPRNREWRLRAGLLLSGWDPTCLLLCTLLQSECGDSSICSEQTKKVHDADIAESCVDSAAPRVFSRLLGWGSKKPPINAFDWAGQGPPLKLPGPLTLNCACQVTFRERGSESSRKLLPLCVFARLEFVWRRFWGILLQFVEFGSETLPSVVPERL